MTHFFSHDSTSIVLLFHIHRSPDMIMTHPIPTWLILIFCFPYRVSTLSPLLILFYFYPNLPAPPSSFVFLVTCLLIQLDIASLTIFLTSLLLLTQRSLPHVYKGHSLPLYNKFQVLDFIALSLSSLSSSQALRPLYTEVECVLRHITSSSISSSYVTRHAKSQVRICHTNITLVEQKLCLYLTVLRQPKDRLSIYGLLE